MVLQKQDKGGRSIQRVNKYISSFGLTGFFLCSLKLNIKKKKEGSRHNQFFFFFFFFLKEQDETMYILLL
jgi:hypothetical protein